MAGEIDFLPFAVGANANVITQPTYVTLPALGSGFASGIAQSAQLNKVWRQSSLIATVIARFIDQQTGRGAIDDGTTDTLLANLTAAIASTSITAVSNNTVANYTYSQTDAGKLIIRSTLSGTTVMSDTLPFPALPAFSRLRVLNADATGLLVITPANGSALDGKAAAAIIGPTQSIELISDGSNYHSLGRPIRTKLGSNLILSVSASGNDNANGITSPFATLQAAVNVLFSQYDMNGYAMAFGLGAGTFAGAVIPGQPVGSLGGYPIAINGVGSGSTTLRGTNANALQVSGANVIVGQMTLTATGSSGAFSSIGYCVLAVNGATIGLNAGLTFGAAQTAHIGGQGSGYVTTGGNAYTVTGGATSHYIAAYGGRVVVDNSPVTISNTPNFSVGFATATASGILEASGASYAGSATGQRYFAALSGNINVSGAGPNFFPGSIAGTASTGVYA